MTVKCQLLILNDRFNGPTAAPPPKARQTHQQDPLKPQIERQIVGLKAQLRREYAAGNPPPGSTLLPLID